MSRVSLRDLRKQLALAEAYGGTDLARRLKARIARRERDEAMRSLGLTKVRGATSGRTYWE